jgi:hypothetical protein
MTHLSPHDVEVAVRSVLAEMGRMPGPGTHRPVEVVAGRLFSLRHAEALPWGTREVRVEPRTVVTPLARDFLKQQGVGLRVVARSEVQGDRGAGEWGFAIELERESGMLAAFRRVLLAEVDPWVELASTPGSAARWVVEAPERGAVLLVEQASVAVWRACRWSAVRAAAAAEPGEVARAVRHLGVNLLVVEPAGKSIAWLRQVCASFRTAGAPRAPEGIAQEESACGSPR